MKRAKRLAVIRDNRAIKLTVHMQPVAKARARVGRFGAYTPSKTVVAESMIRMAFMQSKQKKIEGKVPLDVDIWVYVKKPKSARKDAQFPVTRPDLDNYAKTCLDALNKFAYEDDSQIVCLTVCKEYGDIPKIEVTIKELS